MDDPQDDVIGIRPEVMVSTLTPLVKRFTVKN
jgi:hypothetical protein